METKEKVKKKGERTTSIFTVLLWLALIVTMLIIFVNGNINKNALETDENTQTLKISVAGVDVTEEIDEKFKNLKIKDSDNGTFYQYLGVDEEGKYIYEMVSDEHGTNVNLYMPDIDGYRLYLSETKCIIGQKEYSRGGSISYDNSLERYYYSPKIDRVWSDEIEWFVTGFKNEIEIEALYKETTTSLEIKTTFENIPDGEITRELYENLQFVLKAQYNNCPYDNLIFEFDRIEDGKYVYTSNGKILYEDFNDCEIYINNNKYGDYKFDTTYTMGEYTVTRSYSNSNVTIPSSYFVDGKNELDINISYGNERYGAYENVKWVDKEGKIANVSIEYLHDKITGIDENDKYFVEKKLSSNFELSNEYENDADWKILDNVSDENFQLFVITSNKEEFLIPKDVAEQLFEEVIYKGYTYIKKVSHVYVKSTNTVYSYYCGTELVDNGFKESFNIKLKESPIIDTTIVSGTTSVRFITDYYDEGGCGSSKSDYCGIYTLEPTYLKYDLNNKFNIKVNYTGNKNNSDVYVGLFTDDTSENTSTIQKIDNKNAIFTLENINVDDNYYVYIVDENGNKISNSSIVYDKNKVDIIYIDNSKKRELLSLTDVVSSVGGNNNGTFYIDKTSFVDNCITDFMEYEDVINITIEEKEVRDIKIEEVWIDYDNKYNTRPNSAQVEIYANGEKIDLITIEDKDWKYVLEELEKYDENGNEIIYTIKAVAIDQYETTIEGDMVTGFKVINKLIVTEESVDTSDINIWMYVIIAIVSVGVIIIVCVVIVKSKNRK